MYKTRYYNDTNTTISDTLSSSLCCTLYPLDAEKVIDGIHYTKTNGPIYDNIKKRKRKRSTKPKSLKIEQSVICSVPDTPTLPPLYEQNSVSSPYKSLYDIDMPSNTPLTKLTRYETETFPYFDDTHSLSSIPSFPSIAYIPDKQEQQRKPKRNTTLDPNSYIRSKNQRQKAAIQRYRNHQKKLENDKKMDQYKRREKYHVKSRSFHRKHPSLRLSTTDATSECEVDTVYNKSNDNKRSFRQISGGWDQEIVLPSFDGCSLSLSSSSLSSSSNPRSPSKPRSPIRTNGNYKRNTNNNPFVTDNNDYKMYLKLAT